MEWTGMFVGIIPSVQDILMDGLIVSAIILFSYLIALKYADRILKWMSDDISK